MTEQADRAGRDDAGPDAASGIPQGDPSPAAQRALAEAAARRKDYLREEAARQKEIGGRGGKEPVRYGDWEVKGLATDF